MRESVGDENNRPGSGAGVGMIGTSIFNDAAEIYVADADGDGNGLDWIGIWWW